MEDQVFHDLEQRYLLLHHEHLALLADNRNVKEHNENLKVERESLLARADAAERAKSEISLELKQMDLKAKDLAGETEVLKDKLARFNVENDRLREDFQIQAQELSSLQSRLKDVQVLCSESQSKELPLQYELSKVSRERDLLAKQVDGLEEEMRRFSSSERTKVFEVSEKANELGLQVVSLEADVVSKTRELAMLRDQLGLSQEKVDALNTKLSQSEAEWITQSAASAQEIDAVKRLAEIYKGHFEDATHHIEQLEGKLSHADDGYKKSLLEVQASMQARVNDFERSAAEEKAALEARVAELRSKLEAAADAASSCVAVVPALRPVMNVEETPGFAELNVTELYDRIVTLERSLIDEQRQRKEAELYMGQILKEVESKAPALSKQRRDYQRMVEYHSQLTAKLDELAGDNARLKAATKEQDVQIQALAKHRDQLEQHSVDLSSQVQHLLRYSAGAVHMVEGDDAAQASEVASDVVSQRLVTFSNISELQQRNSELLNIIRSLTDGSAPVSQDDGVMAEELQELREARKRSEEMIAVIIQQRDMYKSLVDGEAPQHALVAAPGVALLENGGDHEVQYKLAQAAEANKRLQDQLARAHEADRLLHESVDKLRSELTAAQLSSSQASSEARFHKERVDRLEDALKLAQQESSVSLARRVEMDKMIQELQRDGRERDERLHAAQEHTRLTSDTMHRLQVELEVTKASETRLIQQVAETREEMKRNVSLAEHLHRIEQGLHDRSEAEKQLMSREKESLENAYRQLKKQLDERSTVEHQKLVFAEDELRAMQLKFERKSNETTLLTESLSKEREMLKFTQDRLSLVEKQLSVAQERLLSVHGAQIGDDIIEKSLAEKEVAIQQAQHELSAVRQQLAAAEVHAEQYRKISAANESALKALQAKYLEGQHAQEAALSEAQSALEKTRVDLQEQRTNVAQLVRELEEAKEQERRVAGGVEESTKSLQAELELVNAENAQLRAHIDTVRADVNQYKESAQVAFENYERELQHHARAERELREEKEQAHRLKDEVIRLHAQVADQSLQGIRMEKVFADEKSRRAQEVEALKEQVETLQQANGAMHDQIQAYSLRFERVFDQKAAAVEGSMAAEAEATGATVEDVAELRRSSAELREILKYMKREKEVLQAKLHVVESENVRYLNQLQSLQKSVDELRLELKRASEKRSDVRSEEDFAKLLAEVEQLNLLRDSNAHLRSENDELLKKLKHVTADLQLSQAQQAPHEETIRRLSADKEALELVTDQLTNDVTYWKNRLHILVSRYNDVDPEEHRLLKSKLEETQIALVQAEQRATGAEVSCAATVAEKERIASAQVADKEKEIAAQKAAMESTERNATTLRDRLRAFKTKIEDLEAKNRDMLKAAGLKDSQLTALMQQLEEAKAQAGALTLEVSEFKKQQAVASAAAAAAEAVLSACSNVEAGMVEEAAPAVAVPAATKTPAKARASLGKRLAVAKAKAASPEPGEAGATAAAAAPVAIAPATTAPVAAPIAVTAAPVAYAQDDEPAAKKSRIEEVDQPESCDAPTPSAITPVIVATIPAEEAGVSMESNDDVFAEDTKAEEMVIEPVEEQPGTAAAPTIAAPTAFSVKPPALATLFSSVAAAPSPMPSPKPATGFGSFGAPFGSLTSIGGGSLFGASPAAGAADPAKSIAPTSASSLNPFLSAASKPLGSSSGPFSAAFGSSTSTTGSLFSTGNKSWAAAVGVSLALPTPAPVTAAVDEPAQPVETQLETSQDAAEGQEEAEPAEVSEAAPAIVPAKVLDPAKRREMRAQRFATATAAAAAAATVSAGAVPTVASAAAVPAVKGRKRPIKGLKSQTAAPTQTLAPVQEEDAAHEAGEADDGAAE